MKKLFTYLKEQKYSLIFEIIVVVLGMFLALTVDGIRDEYKEQQVIKANIVKNKKLLLDSYKKIVSEIKGDTINLSVSRNFSKEMTIKIDSFLNGKMSENDFKSCFGCIEWVIIDLGSPINLEEYKIISSLPLFQLNSTMLDHFEKNKENDNLIWLIGQANMNIRLFYNIVESKIRVSMNEINKDVFNNIEYFKRNSQQFPAMYFPRGYKENFNVQDNVFLNMLLVRRAYVREWDSNISDVLINTRFGLKDIYNAIEALENDLNLELEEETTKPSI